MYELGGMTFVDDAKKLIENMCVAKHKKTSVTGTDGKVHTLQTYSDTLANFLACEGVLKMIFRKE